MNINLSPIGNTGPLVVTKQGDTLVIDYKRYDFSFINDGDTLPSSATDSAWLGSYNEIKRVNGAIELTILMPIPSNPNQAQSFPEPLLNAPDGVIKWPDGDPDAEGNIPPQPQPDLGVEITEGIIDKTQLVTKAAHDAQQVAEQIRIATDQLNALTRQANAQVSALTGRVGALEYLINEQDPDDPDYIAPTAAEIAELPVRKAQLKSWNSYNVKLGRVKTAAGWPATPAWPVMPEPYTSETSAVAVSAA